MKKILVLAVFISNIANAVIIRNETGTDYMVTDYKDKKNEKLISLKAGTEVNIGLKNKDTLTLEKAGKKNSFKLKASEQDISSINLKKDNDGKLYADIFGKPGADDYFDVYLYIG